MIGRGCRLSFRFRYTTLRCFSLEIDAKDKEKGLEAYEEDGKEMRVHTREDVKSRI